MSTFFDRKSAVACLLGVGALIAFFATEKWFPSARTFVLGVLCGSWGAFMRKTFRWGEDES